MQAVFLVSVGSAVMRIVTVCQLAFFMFFTLCLCCKTKRERTTSTKEGPAEKDLIVKKNLESNKHSQTGIANQDKKGAVDNGAVQTQTSQEKVVPKIFPLDEKGQQIAKGIKRRKNDYPTMGDINSDWDEKTDGDEKKVEKNEKSANLNQAVPIDKQTKEKSATLMQPEPISKEAKEKSVNQDPPASKGREEVKEKQPVKDKSTSKGKSGVKEKSHRSALEKQQAEKKKEFSSVKQANIKSSKELKEISVVAVPVAKLTADVTAAGVPSAIEKVEPKVEYSYKEGKTQEESQPTESQLGPSIASAIKNNAKDGSDRKDNSSKKAKVVKVDDVKQFREGDEE